MRKPHLSYFKTNQVMKKNILFSFQAALEMYLLLCQTFHSWVRSAVGCNWQSKVWVKNTIFFLSLSMYLKLVALVETFFYWIAIVSGTSQIIFYYLMANVELVGISGNTISGKRFPSGACLNRKTTPISLWSWRWTKTIFLLVNLFVESYK